MNRLLGLAKVHGPMDRWNGYEKIDATVVNVERAGHLLVEIRHACHCHR
jgi:hypothetical protein